MSELLWIGDPGARDASDDQRATYVGPAKAFCPCDTGNPQDCKPEEWRPAHSPRPPCERCGAPLYAHQGNYCRRPTPWAPRRNDDWIWHSLGTQTPWTPRAVEVVRAALDSYYAVGSKR